MDATPPGVAAAPADPAGQARRALAVVLEAQMRGTPALVVDSPPGAGKSQLVEYVATQELSRRRGRTAIATQTNEQAIALAGRLARRFPDQECVLYVRSDLTLPTAILTLPNLQVARGQRQIPPGPVIVVANAALWSWVRAARFDLLVVDEAYQLTDSAFAAIAGLAERFLLVGDPGQIAPVVTCDVDRWRADPAGPHLPAPRALLARRPDLPRLALPVSRRLVPDTVALLQPALYRSLPFIALSRPRDRRLVPGPAAGGDRWAALDPAIDRAAGGASLVQVTLPSRPTGDVDEGLAEVVVGLIRRLLARKTVVVDDGKARPLGPGMIGVVCAHVAQVAAVVERLPPALDGVLVETADRFQGLERAVMIAHHPLSGRLDADAFHLDPGRWCVMLSRHRVAAFVVSRDGVERMLRAYTPLGDRVLGAADDPELAGLRAHLALARALADPTRAVSISA